MRSPHPKSLILIRCQQQQNTLGRIRKRSLVPVIWLARHTCSPCALVILPVKRLLHLDLTLYLIYKFFSKDWKSVTCFLNQPPRAGIWFGGYKAGQSVQFPNQSSWVPLSAPAPNSTSSLTHTLGSRRWWSKWLCACPSHGSDVVQCGHLGIKPVRGALPVLCISVSSSVGGAATLAQAPYKLFLLFTVQQDKMQIVLG